MKKKKEKLQLIFIQKMIILGGLISHHTKERLLIVILRPVHLIVRRCLTRKKLIYKVSPLIGYQKRSIGTIHLNKRYLCALFMAIFASRLFIKTYKAPDQHDFCKLIVHDHDYTLTMPLLFKAATFQHMS